MMGVTQISCDDWSDKITKKMIGDPLKVSIFSKSRGLLCSLLRDQLISHTT